MAANSQFAFARAVVNGGRGGKVRYGRSTLHRAREGGGLGDFGCERQADDCCIPARVYISRPATHRYTGTRLPLPMQEVHFLCTWSASHLAKRERSVIASSLRILVTQRSCEDDPRTAV